MKTFNWKTDETDIDQKTRTIIATESVTVKEERVEEFTLEQKEQRLASARTAVEISQKIVADLEAEMAEAKIALGVVEVAPVKEVIK